MEGLAGRSHPFPLTEPLPDGPSHASNLKDATPALVVATSADALGRATRRPKSTPPTLAIYRGNPSSPRSVAVPRTYAPERALLIARSLLLGYLLAVAAHLDAAPFQTDQSNRPHPAVCRVAVEERGGKAFGSGTLIDARDQYGLVITNWHVVRDATGKIEVQFPGGFKSEARPLKLDETWDLAALVVWRPPTEPALLAAHSPAKGETLTICGYGQGDYLAQTGRCTDYYSPEVGQPQELVELNVEARQGDSGGPIFNERGELAGVLFGAARGTTLGSFGGRVQTFLATLAPDIGTRQPTLLAQSDLNRGREPSDRPTVLNTPGTIDPFLAAEKASPRPTPRQSDKLPVAAKPQQLARQKPQPQMPPPALTDRSSSPRLAAAKPSAEAWQPIPKRPASENPGFAAPSQSKQVNAGFAPQTSEEPESLSAGAVDWTEDSRTLLAVLGAAALVVAGLRAMA